MGSAFRDTKYILETGLHHQNRPNSKTAIRGETGSKLHHQSSSNLLRMYLQVIINWYHTSSSQIRMQSNTSFKKLVHLLAVIHTFSTIESVDIFHLPFKFQKYVLYLLHQFYQLLLDFSMSTPENPPEAEIQVPRRCFRPPHAASVVPWPGSQSSNLGKRGNIYMFSIESLSCECRRRSPFFKQSMFNQYRSRQLYI